MSNGSITNQRDKLNHIHKLIAEYGRENEEKLIRFILSQKDANGKPYTLATIAKALGITPQTLSDRYPTIRKETLHDNA